MSVEIEFLGYPLFFVYIHLPCTVDRDGTSFLNPGNMSTKEKCPCQAVNMEQTVPGEGM